jgi:hypothetical protein
MNYAPKFRVFSTSDTLSWNYEDQLLSWYPEQSFILNQIIIVPEEKLAISVLPASPRPF